MSELHFILILFSCKIRAPGCKNKPTSFKPLILPINLTVFGKMTAKLLFLKGRVMFVHLKMNKQKTCQ